MPFGTIILSKLSLYSFSIPLFFSNWAAEKKYSQQITKCFVTNGAQESWGHEFNQWIPWISKQQQQQQKVTYNIETITIYYLAGGLMLIQ